MNSIELNFRAVFIPAMELDMTKEVIIHSATAKKAQEDLEVLANYTLFLHESNMMKDYSNMGYIEELVEGEWLSLEVEGVDY